MQPRCCVVIPTYNEAQHLAALLSQVFAQQALISTHELWVIVVDDNSPDGSAGILRGLQRSYPRLHALGGEKRGLGAAYRRGFAYAIEDLHADLLVQMDGDLQHDPAALPFLLHLCQPGVAAVVGSRFAAGGSTPSFSRSRRWISIAGNWLIHRYAGLPPLCDYTSGYRCLDARRVAQCRFEGLAIRGYAFQSSLIAELLLTRAPVLELPIVFGRREHGRSKLSLHDYLEFTLNLRRLRARSRATCPPAANQGATPSV